MSSGPKASWSNRERRRGLRRAARYSMEVVELGPFAPRFDTVLLGAGLGMLAYWLKTPDKSLSSDPAADA